MSVVGDTFSVVEEVRAAEAGLGGGTRAGRGASGPEDAPCRRFPAAVLVGSCFPCKVSLEVAGSAELWGAVPFPVVPCSEAGLVSLLAQQEGEERKGRNLREKNQS